MKRAAWSVFIAWMGMVGVGGCAAKPPLSPTQMEALQTREVEAGADRAFAAATNAVLDAGYRLRMSDADAGILAAELRQDPAVAANVGVIVATALVTLGHAVADLPPTYHELCVQVMPEGSGRSKVRIRSYLNASAAHEPEVVEQIWTLMQRQVLMKEPSGVGGK